MFLINISSVPFFFTLNFEGLCMTYVQQSKAMKGYDCATFDEGCPSVNYFSDEAYKCKKF